MKLTFRIWVWIAVVVLALISIFITPNFLQKGVLITNVETNSSAFNEGLRQGQIITAIDGEKINNLDDYSNIIFSKFDSNESVKITITTTESEYIFYSLGAPSIIVSEIPTTNVKTGLDLSGGARALVQAEDHSLTKEESEILVDMIDNRFNVYGISDMSIRAIQDLGGNYFVSIEIAGATPKDLENLISQQGKFEGKIGNETIFIGGNQDIKDVSKGGQDSGIYSCDQVNNGYLCQFRFVVTISQESAERQAAVTQNLSVITSNGKEFLSKPLDLYLDGILYNNLSIGADLKGNPAIQISIQGSGTGSTFEEAKKSANEEMNNLQTILQTGSLPFKLEIVKLDTISATLGKSFTKYLFIAGFAALLVVAIIIFVRYGIKTSLVPLIVCTSEIIITLGIAAFIQWDLDLASIAGILAAIGTGVDDQIVVLDETKNKRGSVSVKEKIKRAFVIIMGAYFTSVASLIPLWWAGAGLLKGFVFTTLIGITAGVLITRPAFADLIAIIEKNK
jgi:preprotein translocase subunit SecD